MCLYHDKYYVLLFLLFVGTTIKYDIVIFPALYFIYNLSASKWIKVCQKTLLLFVVTFGTFIILKILIPGGFVEKNLWNQAMINLMHFLSYPYAFAYPPVLGFFVPILLTLYGWRSLNKFHICCDILGLLIFIILLILSNFRELRAEMPIVLLIIPSAVNGLKVMLQDMDPINNNNVATST
jgi:hypothetical protein